MCEVPDCFRLKGTVPAMVALQVRTQAEVPQTSFVVVKYIAYFTHVGPAVIIFSSQCEFTEVTEGGYTFCVKMPAAMET